MDIHLAIRRIQELEKEVAALTKKADDASYSARALRENNKALKQSAKIVYPTGTVEIPLAYTVRCFRNERRADIEPIMRQALVQYIGEHMLDNDLCEMHDEIRPDLPSGDSLITRNVLLRVIPPRP